MDVVKAALESSVRYLAYELGPQNIRVNAISSHLPCAGTEILYLSCKRNAVKAPPQT